MMPSLIVSAKALILITFVFSLLGCSFGPSYFSSSRIEYNSAIQVTEQEELLLNIVRLRYNEPPAFLKVSGISSQFEVSSNLGLSAETDNDARLQSLQPEVGVGFSERPTVSFRPQQDKQFMQQVMAPVGPETLYRLIEYGWGVDRVFSLLVRQANGVGEPIGLGREGDAEPAGLPKLFSQLERWQRKQLLKMELNRQDKLMNPVIRVDEASVGDVISLEEAGFGLQKRDEGYALSRTEISFDLLVGNALKDTSEWKEFARKLNLRPDAEKYAINVGTPQRKSSRELSLRMHSPLSFMGILSSGVQIPREQVQEGVVAKVEPSTEGHFRVYSQASQPENAYLTVEHRNNWFYIKSDDLNSRRSFGLLSTLMRQEVKAGGAQNLPVLTLPVGR